MNTMESENVNNLWRTVVGVGWKVLQSRKIRNNFTITTATIKYNIISIQKDSFSSSNPGMFPGNSEVTLFLPNTPFRRQLLITYAKDMRIFSLSCKHKSRTVAGHVLPGLHSSLLWRCFGPRGCCRTNTHRQNKLITTSSMWRKLSASTWNLSWTLHCSKGMSFVLVSPSI